MSKLSIYIHIPFCVKKCNYCAFYSLPAADEALKEAYFNALSRQIAALEYEGEIATVYFGGGTPPLLGIDRLCKLISLLKARLNVTEHCEITLEVNPKTVAYNDLCRLREAGFNRVSVGVQSANEEILKFLGRIHSFDDSRICIENAFNAGFENVSADIMFALPYRCNDDFALTVKSIMSTSVTHISAYSLQVEEGTPFYRRQKLLELPDEDTEEAQYFTLCDIAREQGFSHYEISSFAKNGFQSKHNLNYWRCGEYFGFGAGAHSYYKGKRFFALSSIEDYLRRSGDLFSPTNYHEAPYLTEAEKEEERVMLGLRTSDGAYLSGSRLKKAEEIAKMGFGVVCDGVFVLNERGYRVSNKIIADILSV